MKKYLLTIFIIISMFAVIACNTKTDDSAKEEEKDSDKTVAKEDKSEFLYTIKDARMVKIETASVYNKTTGYAAATATKNLTVNKLTKADGTKWFEFAVEGSNKIYINMQDGIDVLKPLLSKNTAVVVSESKDDVSLSEIAVDTPATIADIALPVGFITIYNQDFVPKVHAINKVLKDDKNPRMIQKLVLFGPDTKYEATGDGSIAEFTTKLVKF